MNPTVLFVVLLLAPDTQLEQRNGSELFRQEIEQASELTASSGHSTQEIAEAKAVLAAAIADPRFAGLDAETKAEAYTGSAWAAIRQQDIKGARDLLELATHAYPEGSENWLLLARGEDQLGHHDASASALSEFLRRDPEGLHRAESFIPRLLPELDPVSDADLGLLRLLAGQGWKSEGQIEGLAWYGLALAEARRHHAEAARAAIARIRTPSTVAMVRADKRLDGLYEFDSREFDPVALAKRRVAELQDQVNQTPNRLRPRVDLGEAMLVLGQAAKVVELSDHVIESVKSGLIQADDPEQLVWVANLRSSALLQLGRVEEALQPLREAAATPVNGQPNVNQALNLAGIYCDLGRGAEALKTARSAGAMNGYGRMVQAFVMHCAARLEGDESEANRQLEYLREHRSEGRGLYTDALVAEARLDEAAAQVIERLDSEKLRGPMLLELQDFLPPQVVPENAGQVQALWEQLLAREDVRRAVNKVGRRERYEIMN